MNKEDVIVLCSISLSTFVFSYTALCNMWEPAWYALITSLSLSSVPLLMLCGCFFIGDRTNNFPPRRTTGRVNYYINPATQSPSQKQTIQNYKDSLTISEALDIVDSKVKQREDTTTNG